jgi:hypothetical protein
LGLFILDGTNTLRFDEYLVNDGNGPEHAPGSPIVFGLFDEYIPASRYRLIVLLIGHWLILTFNFQK